MPVVEHYERQRKLAKISAVPPPEEVRAQMSAWPHCTSESKQALQKPCCTHRLAERTASSYDMHWCMMSEGPSSVCVSMRLMREDECQHRGCPKVKALIVVLSLISYQAAPNVHARMRVLGPAVICESTEGAGRLAFQGSNGSVTKHAHMRCIWKRRLAAQVFVEVQRALDSLPSQSSKTSARNSDYAAPHAQEAQLAA